MSVWVRARTAPTAIVAIAIVASSGCQLQRSAPNATKKTRAMPPMAASLVQIAMKPVTGVGAPT